MVHEDIYGAVRDRLAHFTSSGDLRVILDPRAAGEIAALRAAAGWPPFAPPPAGPALRRELDALALAGTVEFIRSQELPPADRLEAVLEAMEIFTAVYPVAPAIVPEPMRAMCAVLAANPPGVHHAELHNEAIDTLDAVAMTRDRAQADQAIWLLAAAFLAARADADRARHLSVLGTAWVDRYGITGMVADVDHAVAVHRRAVALDVSDPADRAGHQANLSGALLTRYNATGTVSDLDEAVTTARTAAGIARAAGAPAAGAPGAGAPAAGAIGHARRTGNSALATALLRRYLYGRVPADLDEAIVAGGEAVAAAPAGDPARPGLQANLANLLLERFTRQWRVADLTEAVATARAAADAAAPHDPARAVALSALALAHLDHFAYAANLADLDQAIEVGREAVAAAPGGHPVATCLSNLGAALRTRYDWTGDTRALDEAITVLRQAVHAVDRGHASRPGFLNNLGNALRGRFEVKRAAAAPAAADPADIREAITLLTEAAGTAHRGGPDRAGYVANLASALVLAARNGAYPGALDQAIETLEAELAATGDDHPLRHTYLISLGHAWLDRFDASGEDRALAAAVGYLRQAVAAVPAGHPRRAEYLGWLGGALRSKAERSGATAAAPGHEAAREAIAASRSAATIATAPAVIRALAARDWGQVAASMGDAAEAVTGLSAAVNLLDRVAWHGLQRRDQERNLGRFAALACDAAAWAIEAGQPERAVELLEQGRGVLLAQATDLRARQHDLGQTRKDLADQLARIDDKLEHLPPADDPVRAADPVLAANREDLARQRDAVLEQIRDLPGFRDFRRPPEFTALTEAAAGGPVVIINVSGYRCDALIVTTGGVQVTPLTRLTGADMVARASAFLPALRLGPDGSQVIADTLAWLWDTVMIPLLPALTAACAAPPGQRPRVWWCPTGPLTFLPLHAAGRADGSGATVLDRFVSSYTPTLRLLLRARTPAQRSGGQERPLVVAMPHTPGLPELPKAAIEADDFAGRFSRAIQLRDARATVDAVRQALELNCPLAHFACHGTQDVTDSSAGHLRLHDGRLSIAEIAGLRLDAAELAYLSACETSVGSTQLSDEVITLASAFRLAGYRHAIGTLWTISDAHAAAIARHVYQALQDPRTGGIVTSGTAAALDAAVLALRKTRPSAPWLWASYVHIGP
jgi:tetratricopeptide (TPR) repeat protein